MITTMMATGLRHWRHKRQPNGIDGNNFADVCKRLRREFGGGGGTPAAGVALRAGQRNLARDDRSDSWASPAARLCDGRALLRRARRPREHRASAQEYSRAG